MSPIVFGRHRRLANGEQFAAVFAYKRRVYSARFCAYAAPNKIGFARIGLTVSRRVSKKAVVRNRIKRQIRASFCAHYALDELGMLDYVVVAKRGADERTKHALRRELDGLWKKARRKSEKPKSDNPKTHDKHANNTNKKHRDQTR